MTFQEVAQMIESIGLPFVYDSFPNNEAPQAPYIVFNYPNNDDFGDKGGRRQLYPGGRADYGYRSEAAFYT